MIIVWAIADVGARFIAPLQGRDSSRPCKGAMNQGAMNQGAMNQGAMNQGAMNQGAMNQGAMNQGAMNQGAMNQGAMNRAPTAEMMIMAWKCLQGDFVQYIFVCGRLNHSRPVFSNSVGLNNMPSPNLEQA